MINKRLIAGITVFLITSSLLALPVAAAAGGSGTAPAKAASANDPPVATSGDKDPGQYKTGGIPMPWDNDVKMTDEDISFSEIKRRLKGSSDEASLASTDYTPRTVLPKRYPGNTDAEAKKFISSRFPKVRNQEPFGTCWAFGTVGCAEFYEISHGNADKTLDLSEAYLASGIYRTQQNPVVGNDDAVSGINSSVSDRDLLDAGGNYGVAGRYLSKGYGFINEADYSYYTSETDERFDENGNLKSFDAEALKRKAVLQMTDMYYADIKTENGQKIIKEAIMQNGAAGLFFHAELPGDTYYDTSYSVSKNAYYFEHEVDPDDYSTSIFNPNHVVTAVGWNDDFPKEYFVDGHRPEHNGAWLIRNSWGGDDLDFYDYRNYFWLSYEDRGLKEGAYIFDVKPGPANYDNNYYYDSQVHLDSLIGDFGDSYAANVFKVRDGSNEKLTEIVINVNEPSDYEINVYRNIKDPSDPSTGTVVSGAATKGKISLAGIYTIPLKEGVLLEKGSCFAVEVKTGDRSVCIERKLVISGMTSTVGIKKNQSFIHDDEGWHDLWHDLTETGLLQDGWGNFCISAHTVFTDETMPVETRTEETVKDASGKETVLVRDSEYNTYKTKEGKDVLVLSDAEGKSAGKPVYQFTGKRIRPSRKSYVVYKGVLYKYKTDYTVKFKKNKKRGTAKAIIKWKKKSAPYKSGTKKSTMEFDIAERNVTADMVSFKVKKNKIKKLRVKADGVTMKPKKKDFSCSVSADASYIINFRNNYKGTVVTKK